jgi:hypothetical protein
MEARTVEEPAFEPVPEPHDDPTLPPIGRVRLRAQLRVPLTLSVRPWARLYELPNGRRCWIVRLWEHGEAVPHCLPTSALRRYARQSGLRQLEAELAEADGGDRAP